MVVYRVDRTTCPFSMNVGRAFGELAQPVTQAVTLKNVYSPATKLTYTLDCSFSSPVRCTGGNNAVIYLEIEPNNPASTVVSSEPTQIDLPSSAAVCGSVGGMVVYQGHDQTSCPFSMNVGRAFDKLEQPVTDAVMLEGVYSPVTDLTYTLDCSFSSPVRCTGGNSGVVFLQQ